jgi:hypothetical protein
MTTPGQIEVNGHLRRPRLLCPRARLATAVRDREPQEVTVRHRK